MMTANEDRKAATSTMRELWSTVQNGPSISVRGNKSSYLRAVVRGANVDLEVSGRVTASNETDPFMKWQQKAAKHTMKKEVKMWHRHLMTNLNKLNRRQMNFYDHLLVLDRKKTELGIKGNAKRPPARSALKTRDSNSSADGSKSVSEILPQKSVTLPQLDCRSTSLQSRRDSRRDSDEMRMTSTPHGQGRASKPSFKSKQQQQQRYSRYSSRYRNTSREAIPLYKRDNSSGDIVQMEFDYTRKRFEVPQPRDEELYEQRLQEEAMKTDTHMQQLSLCVGDLDTLNTVHKKPSPRNATIDGMLKEVPGLSNDPRRRQQGENKLTYLVRLMSLRDADLLTGMDTNSTEALRLCRYLRMYCNEKDVTFAYC